MITAVTRQQELEQMLQTASPTSVKHAMRVLMATAHSGLKHGLHNDNLACKEVCHGCWVTSVLLEAGVISSVEEVPPYSGHVRRAREQAGLDIETGRRGS